VIALLQGGEAYRHVGTTDMNQKSSRAHTLFKLIIESKALDSQESNNTLKFASRAKTIRMDARVNESMDDKTLLRAYRQEIEELKAKLAAMESMMRTGGDEGEKPPQQSLSALEDPDTDGDNQLIMLQMIDHMERLILKGEEQAKRDGSTGSTGSLSSSKNRESMT
ncbi:kif11, partial [Symbiodinium microadriaticum]